MIVTARYAGHAPTEVKKIILYHPSTTQIMMDPHYVILWADNSGESLGRHPSENYSAGLDDAQKQAIIAQQSLRSKMLVLWINNYMNIDAKRKLNDFKYAYTFNYQYYGVEMFFVIVKMV